MLPLQEGLVYGPVRSRRLGQSLGINILPRNGKVCTFNCSYCQYGWTPPNAASTAKEAWPTPAAIVKTVTARLQRAAAQGEVIHRLTLAGNGEPTLHPQIDEVVTGLREARDRCAPGIPLAILSNSSTLDRPAVQRALRAIDERYMKLDAGDQAMLRRINAATVPFVKIVDGLKRLPNVVIQALFVRDRLGRIDNAGDLAVGAWIGALSQIKPTSVQIYSIDRAPAWPYLNAVPTTRLDEIAARVRAAGLTAETFQAVNGSSH
jgi:wyosine [tRNA(Phe)-imidazoG37] synthetase (radical SAM superfamily)